MVALIWSLTVLALALWTLLGWCVHEVLTLGPVWLQTLPERMQDWSLPPWLAHALPPETLLATASVLDTVFGWLGSAAVLLVWGLWAAWAVGAALMVGMALLLSHFVRRDAVPAPAGAGA